MDKVTKEARILATEILPIIANKRLGVIVLAFELLKQALINKALGW